MQQQQGSAAAALRLALLSAAEGLPPLGQILLGAARTADEEEAPGSSNLVAVPDAASSLHVPGSGPAPGPAASQQLLGRMVVEALREVLGASAASGIGADTPLMAAGQHLSLNDMLLNGSKSAHVVHSCRPDECLGHPVHLGSGGQAQSKVAAHDGEGIF